MLTSHDPHNIAVNSSAEHPRRLGAWASRARPGVFVLCPWFTIQTPVHPDEEDFAFKHVLALRPVERKIQAGDTETGSGAFTCGADLRQMRGRSARRWRLPAHDVELCVSLCIGHHLCSDFPFAGRTPIVDRERGYLGRQVHGRSAARGTGGR
jgi:hypothetical protein